MAPKTRQELLEEIEYWQDRADRGRDSAKSVKNEKTLFRPGERLCCVVGVVFGKLTRFYGNLERNRFLLSSQVVSEMKP